MQTHQHNIGNLVCPCYLWLYMPIAYEVRSRPVLL